MERTGKSNIKKIHAKTELHDKETKENKVAK